MTSNFKPAVQYEHSEQIFQRRRSLFPITINTDSEEDSDLGHISPLRSDSSEEDDKDFDDYHILGVVEHEDDQVSTPNNLKRTETATPSVSNLQKSCSENTGLCNLSPSHTYQTPHDTYSNKSKLPKLIRKSVSDSPVSIKRKLSSDDSPISNKQLKLDPKNSKVRTTLFPDTSSRVLTEMSCQTNFPEKELSNTSDTVLSPDFSIPSKNFYSNSVDIMEVIRNRTQSVSAPGVTFNVKHKTSTNRNRSKFDKKGTINNGIIRKKKNAKVRKTTLKKVAEYDPKHIKTYLEALRELNENEGKENVSQRKMIIMPPQLNLAEASTSKKMITMPDPVDKTETTNSFSMNLRKRSSSPSLDQSEPKKFFKSRMSKGVVTLSDDIKLEIDCGVVKMLDKEKPVDKNIHFSTNDLIMEDDSETSPPVNVDSILASLEENISPENVENQIVLEAFNSITASENSILLHERPAVNDEILSPISQMCDVTSGLALNSPKGVKNLTSVLNNMPNVTEDGGKVFPIFTNPRSGIAEKKATLLRGNAPKKFKKLPESQMLLDAGQKEFGVVHCTKCDFMYHKGDMDDENLHLSYHNGMWFLKFYGWKNERVIADFDQNGRILQILPGDSKLWWKRCKNVIDFINNELGFYDVAFNLDHCQVLLYIKQKQIVGCTVALVVTEAHKLLTLQPNKPEMCSTETHTVKCGVSRIWVSRNYRNNGIGTAMLNALKLNFSLGTILSNDDIAFSTPTEAGKKFATKYFNTPNFLIFF